LLLNGPIRLSHEICVFFKNFAGEQSQQHTMVCQAILLLVLCRLASCKELDNVTGARKDFQGIQPRIVGGDSARIGAYTFFCRIDLDGFPWCGGTLVAPDIILTAAHCKPRYENGTLTGVLVNGYHNDLKVNKDQEYRSIDYMLPHPDFSTSNPYNDIMLLKLSKPVTTIPWVELNRDTEEPKTYDTVTVMGLGSLSEGGNYPNVLQEANVTIVDHTTCYNAYTTLGLSINDDIMMCAGTNDEYKDACQGDSGGPLINQGGQQVGVVSFGYGCDRRGFPGVYSRTMVRPWVHDWLGENMCKMTRADYGPDWCFKASRSGHDPTAAPTQNPPTSPTASPTTAPTPIVWDESP
jgi:trypsin